ncbi:MAG TPA: hypothetical protein VFJ14_10815 [Nocardioidaceae bacterium]|nr:hypothetical protein [Nocardioidaceae bacterium]
MADSRTAPHARYRRGLITSVVNNASAYGFSVMITGAYGMLGQFHGKPSAFEVLLFALGAVGMISVVEAIASDGFRRRLASHPDDVVLLGTAGNLLSVLFSLGAVYVVGARVADPAVWAVAPMVAAGLYVLVEGAELAVAEYVQARKFSEREAEPDDPAE